MRTKSSVNTAKKTDDGTRSYAFTETQDWFSHNIPSWSILLPLVETQSPRVLEIGSWEGRSGVWLLTTLCSQGGSLVCIDHFDLMRTAAGRERYAKITYNLGLTGRPFRVMDSFSFPALMTLLEEEMSNADPGYSFIYVDGSHEADDTLLDGELAWRLAKKGAIVIFDDYGWNKEPSDSPHHPKRGIDAFLAVHEGEYARLSGPSDYQVVLQKTSEMRIGFLVKDKADSGLDAALEYGINIALTINSAYAVPAAVAMRSAVEYTAGRITFYVVDCGLAEDDRVCLRRSLTERSDVTLNFLAFPEERVANRDTVWAKVDMIDILPVERVLYLDADVLVQGSLQELWHVDMMGKAIGAAIDIGFPMGHDAISRAPYFNAGVLLMDLTKMRSGSAGLKEVALQKKSSRFADQDALNVHFKDDWHEFSLSWNAQGLGTYADCPSPERRDLDLAAMKEPQIVHFTGPVHPR